MRRELLQFGTQLRGGEDLPSARRLLPLLQEALFLLPAGPKSVLLLSTPRAPQAFRPSSVALVIQSQTACLETHSDSATR